MDQWRFGKGGITCYRSYNKEMFELEFEHQAHKGFKPILFTESGLMMNLKGMCLLCCGRLGNAQPKSVHVLIPGASESYLTQ